MLTWKTNNAEAIRLASISHNPAECLKQSALENFRKEYADIVNRLRNLLHGYIRSKSPEVEDPELHFSMNAHPYKTSRLVQIEVLSSAIWDKGLVERLGAFLAEEPQSYLIHLSEDLEDRLIGVSFFIVSGQAVICYFKKQEDADDFLVKSNNP